MSIAPNVLVKMRNMAETSDRSKLLDFWEQLTLLQRHEDGLLNNRLQALLVTTAFLVGAFSQFRDSNGIAAFIAAFGVAFAWIARGVVIRTAAAIEWYLERLVALDELLFDEILQPYGTRRKEKLAQPKVQVSMILSNRIPTLVVALWAVLLSYSLFPFVSALLSKICG